MMNKRMMMAAVVSLTMSLLPCSPALAAEEPAETVETAGKQQITETPLLTELKYELNQVGEFSLEEDLRFGYGDVAYLREDESYTVMSISGEAIESGITSSKNIGDGHYVIGKALKEDDVNRTGLVSIDGTVLVPCEAASVMLPENREKDGIRFVAVIYATEKTENEDECIIYFTDDMFSFSVGEDDVMYKGYAKIYDIREGRFVEGIQLDSITRNSLLDLSDSFVIRDVGSTVMYDPEGNVIWETTGNVSDSTCHALAVSVSGTNYIVDSAGKDRYRSENSISDLNDALDYYTIYDGEGDAHYHAIDVDGNRVMDAAQPILYNAFGEYFYTKSDDDDGYKLINAKGDTVIDKAKSIIYSLGSYGYATLADESSCLITPSGVYQGLEDINQPFLHFEKDGKAVILNTGEASLNFSDADNVRAKNTGLLVVEEVTSSGSYYGAYDLFTGEKILPSEYTAIETAGDYIFANRTGSGKNSVWEVYHAELVPAE